MKQYIIEYETGKDCIRRALPREVRLHEGDILHFDGTAFEVRRVLVAIGKSEAEDSVTYKVNVLGRYE